MNIEKIRVGKLRCNCYILSNNSNNVLVIDPGDEAEKIFNAIGKRHVSGVIITHHHSDHDAALRNILDKYNTKMYDRYNLCEGFNKIDDFYFEVIYTPGHKEDLITIYFRKEKIMFCGDFIFKNGIGRCDLPGGNVSDMIMSIQKIKKYDKDIILYPGHGIKTTLGYEVNNNSYFNDFV